MPHGRAAGGSSAAGLLLSRPADALIDRLAVVTHTNMSPGTQGSGNSSTNPYGPTTTAGWIGLLSDLGIRHIRDDSTITKGTLKGGDSTTAAALAHQISCYQTLQTAGVGIGTIVSDPEALFNLVNSVLPALAQPLDWIEGMNEENTTYISSPSSWTWFNPPAPWSPLGWGNSRGAWASATAYAKGDYVAGGLTYGGTWVAVSAHTSSAGNSPDTITVPDNGGGAGSTGGIWIPDTAYSGPWVPMWALHAVLMGQIMRNLKTAGKIPAATLICSGGTVSGGTDNMVAQRTLTATAKLAGFSTAYYGCDIGQVHNYGGSPAAVTVTQTALTATSDIGVAYNGIVLGETGGQASSDNGTSELTLFQSCAVDMIEAHRLGQIRVCVYELVDYYDLSGAWPSPIPAWQPVGSPPIPWTATTAFTANQVGIPSGSGPGVSNTGYYFLCTVGGTTGGSQPSGFTSPPAYGATFTDGGVTWKYIGQWEAFGLAAFNPVVLNGTIANDFRKKNGWQYLKNFVAASADPGAQPPPLSLIVNIGSLSSVRAPLLTNRRDGTFNLYLSSNTGSNVTGVTVAPASGVTWTSCGLIDPSVGSTVAGVQNNVSSGSPYTITVKPFPVIVRVTL